LSMRVALESLHITLRFGKRVLCEAIIPHPQPRDLFQEED
jgi:hypothetical protein